MSDILAIKSGDIPFNVRIVREGDKFGLNFCLTHEKPETMVEFYDNRYPHTEFGQFVSRYYIHTLLERKVNQGLNLDGGVECWKINGQAMNEVEKWISEQKNIISHPVQYEFNTHNSNSNTHLQSNTHSNAKKHRI